MDRGYVDFERLHRFTDEAAFFVTRAKKGIRFRGRLSRPVDFATGVQSDHTVGAARCTGAGACVALSATVSELAFGAPAAVRPLIPYTVW